MDERSALTHLRNGNMTGLEMLVRSYQLKAIRSAYLVTQDRQSAEDVVQTVFLQLPQRLKQFDVTRPFEPWFMKCVINDAIKVGKQQSRWASLEQGEADFLNLLDDSVLSPEAQIEVMEVERSLRDALLQLSAQHRAVLVMRYYLEMSEQQISEEIQVAPGTVKSRLSRARSRLSNLLKINIYSTNQ